MVCGEYEGIIQMGSREHRRVGRVFCAEGVWSASGCIEKETFRDPKHRLEQLGHELKLRPEQ